MQLAIKEHTVQEDNYESKKKKPRILKYGN
jgi:hypothetical protein